MQLRIGMGEILRMVHSVLRATVLTLAFSSGVFAQDMTVENRDAVVPENTVPGLTEYIGRPVGRIPNAIPNEVLEGLDIPMFRAYMGMSQDRAPETIGFHFRRVMSIPGIKSVHGDRYVVFSACRNNSCPSKGWVMIDIETHQYLGVIRHMISDQEEDLQRGYLLMFSSDFESFQDIPELYMQGLGYWAEREIFEGDYYDATEFAAVRFVNAAGAIETICSDCIPYSRDEIAFGSAGPLLIIDVQERSGNEDPDVVEHVKTAIRSKIADPQAGCENGRLERPGFFAFASASPSEEELANATVLRILAEGEGIRVDVPGFPDPVYVRAQMGGATYLQLPGERDDPLYTFRVRYSEDRIELRSTGSGGQEAAMQAYIESADEPAEAPFLEALSVNECVPGITFSFMRAFAASLNYIADRRPELAGMTIVFSE